MELDVARLRDSRFASHSTGDGFRAGVLLWSASWHQLPAASVPDDDIELSQLTGYGRVSGEFQKVKAEALHGFVLCSDGRWYHRVVAEKALAAWDGKLKYAFKKLDDRLRKENKKRADEGQPVVPVPTFDDWKAEHFPLTAAFESNGTTKPAATVPVESKDFPAEDFTLSGGTPPEIPRKTLLKGEGEGKGEGLLNTPHTPQGGRRRRSTAEEPGEGFDVFYAAYPRKKGRGAAVKTWNRLAPDAVLQAKILGALAAQRPHLDRRENGRFIPHPSTWLNEGRWDDEIPGAKATAPVDVSGRTWWQVAGFDHPAEAENARCHIGNYRQYRDGRLMAEGAPA
ncbi:DUF1376 domain-containing protein [Variovorax paradoxus]|nr:DUF1376 domain-containing protein [Variovorax paradoxus]